MTRRALMQLAAALAAVLGTTACPQGGPAGCDAQDRPTEPLFAVAQGDGGETCEPPPPCEDCGEGNGDPHVRTFDGLKYNFHTLAEVVAARAPDALFEVQWRQHRLGQSNTAGIGAVAMQIDGSRVTLVGGGSEIRVDGDLVDMGDETSLVLPTGVTVHRDGNKLMVVAADRDGAVHVNRHRAAMGVLVDPPDEHRGAMEGLLGNADGDPTNDVVLANGTVLADPTWEDVHPELGESWRVTDDTTLFDYEPGEGPDTYWDPTFPERAPSLDDFSAEEQAEAEAICLAAGVTDEDLLADCIFDVLVMGDPSYAELAAQQQLARGRELDPRGVGGDPIALPGVPSVRWDTILDGYRFNSRAELLVEDSAGHVLVQVIRDSDGRSDLVALDLAGGSIAWTAPDIEASCTPVADPNGFIFAQLVPRSATAGADNNNADLVAIDPATGEPVPGMRYTSPETDDEPRLSECIDGLGLAPDGTLTLMESGLDVWAFSTDDDAISLDWVRSYPQTQHRNRPTVSSDGSAVFFGYQGATDPIGLVVDRIDLATGTVTGTSPALGSAFTTVPASDEGGLILGVRVASSTGRAPEALIRLADDGEGLVEDWRLTFDAGNPFTVDDEEFREHFGFTTFAVAGDAVVGYARGRILSVDRSTGTPGWAHGAAGTNNHDRIAVDTAGNTYFSSFGSYWLRSLSAAGTVNWEIEGGAPVVPAQLTEAGRIGPVTSDGALIVASQEERTGVIHIAALDLDDIP